jgi:DNA processing protein
MSELATSRSTDELQVAYYYWISQMTHLSERSALKFKEKFPTFESWDSLSPSGRSEAARNTLGESDYSKVLPLNFYALMERAFKDLKSHTSRDIRLLVIHDPLYPDLLKKIADPPLVLFVRGAIEALLENMNVAVIGTRDTTPTGEKVAAKIAKWLGEHNWCIVSGLAKGIDAAAHRGAIEAKAKTIAVMATPLDKVYPAENRELADAIIASGGCWVSEMALWRKPHRGSFVLRDRIQSGLSVAVIPVQTDVEGGTMHTVKYAEQQKRLLLCPRPIPQESSLKQYAGIKRLIETNRAKSFDSEQYSEILDTLSKSLQFLVGAGISIPKIDRLVITDVDKDRDAKTSGKDEGVDGKQHKTIKVKRSSASGRFQIDFDFLSDLDNGKAGKPKKKSKRSVDTEVELLEQLVFEVEQVKNPDGTSLSNVDAFKNWLESKLKILRQE